MRWVRHVRDSKVVAHLGFLADSRSALVHGARRLSTKTNLSYLPVASLVANRCGRFAARIFSCATRRL